MKIDLINLNASLIDHLVRNTQAVEYDGYSYSFNGKKIIQRCAKITPTKTGQFVTLWKRDEEGVTCPLSHNDDFDFVIILCKKEKLIGRFLFPKSILIEQGYIKSESQNGKRGFRVYPDWDQATSKQAVKTQQWQKNYFKRSAELRVDEIS